MALAPNPAVRGPRKRGEAKRSPAGNRSPATAGYASLLGNPLGIPCHLSQVSVSLGRLGDESRLGDVAVYVALRFSPRRCCHSRGRAAPRRAAL